MNWIRIFSLSFLIVVVLGSAKASVLPESPFEVVWDDAAIRVPAAKTFETVVTIHVPPGHYLYADETELEFESLEGVRITAIHYPSPTSHHDEFEGKNVKIFDQDVRILVAGSVPDTLEPGPRELSAMVRFRGCTPKLCLRPDERQVTLHVQVLPPTTADNAGTPEGGVLPELSVAKGLSFRELIKAQSFAEVMAAGAPWVLLVVFLAGVLTSFTPCVWPIIPVILLIVGIHPQHKLRRNLMLSVSLVAGMVLVYAVLGILAAAFGKSLGFLFQNRIFLAGVIIFFIFMSLSMFGLFEIRLPQAWQRALHNLGGHGYRGAFLAGLGTGLIASPCVGPIVAGLLTYVVLQKSYTLGFLLLLVYGCGMGLLFILLGLGLATLTERLRSGNWMLWVKRALGLLLLIPAAFYLRSLTGVSMRDVVMVPESGPHVEWMATEEEGLKQAKLLGRPVVIDFYADWCPPCRSLDRKFFRRGDIVAFSSAFVMIRIDATIGTKEVNRIADKYGVVGLPTVLFLAPDGIPHTDLGVADFDPERIEQSMREALRRTGNSFPPSP